MSKRRKKSRKVSGVRRRRRSVGAAIDVQNTLGIVGGAVIAGYLNKIVPATVNDKVLAAGKVGLGIALPMLVKDGKTKNLMQGIGAGMIAVGSVDLLKSFGALSGDFDIPVINGDVLSGDDEMSGDVLAANEFGADEFGADEEMGADEFGADEFGEDEN